jgi:hypothetical protein
VSWRRVGVCLAIIFAALWLLDVVVTHVSVWRIARQVGLDDPIVTLVPQPLRDKSIANLKDGMTIARFGYSVQVPWAKAKVVKDYPSVAVRGFEDGSSLMIFNPADHIDVLTMHSGNEAAVREAYRPLLGDQATKSHFGYAQVELNTRPGEVSLFHSRRSNARSYMLLSMKSLDIPKGVTEIYTISSPSLRGFQFGDPQLSPTFIELLLFDGRDRALELIFKGPRGGTRPVLTQEQINAMVASMRPVE